MAPSLNRYVRDGLMDQLAPVGTRPLRTIPIGGTIEDRRRIAPYEDVMGIVESQNFIAVSNCACRQRKRADSNSAPCQHPEEVCLHFGDLAHYLVDNGLSRQISKEEAKDILKSSAEAGWSMGFLTGEKMQTPSVIAASVPVFSSRPTTSSSTTRAMIFRTIG